MQSSVLGVTDAIYPAIISEQILCSHHWGRGVHLCTGVLGYKEDLCRQFFLSPLAFPSSVSESHLPLQCCVYSICEKAFPDFPASSQTILTFKTIYIIDD